MAKKNEPTINHTEILSRAGMHIRDEIIRLKQESAEMERQANLIGKVAEVLGYIQTNQQHIQPLISKLLAIESMYLLETGAELGIADEVLAVLKPQEE